MHELGIAQQTLDMALHEAKRHGAARILAIRLRIGDWSGVVPEALQFALETIVQGTPAEGARIELITVKPACICAQCGEEYEVMDYSYTCPDCGTVNDRLSRGREMDLMSLEVA